MKCLTADEVLFSFLSVLSLLLLQVQATAYVEKRIQLYAYNQSDSVTSCQTGLINHSDRLVFWGSANFTGDSELLPTIGIEIQQKNSNFSQFCFIYPQNGCTENGNTPCYCENTTEAGIFHFFVNKTASTAYSHAKMRASLFYKNNSHIYSDEIHLPGIYDPSVSTKTKITINNQIIKVGPQECFVTIYRSEVTADYWCESDYSPCWLEVSLNDSVQAAQRNKSHVHFEAGHYVQNYSTITFKQSTCQFGANEKTTKCIILKEIHPDGTIHLRYVGYFFSVFVPMTFIAIFCYVAVRTKCWNHQTTLMSCFARLCRCGVNPQYQGKLWYERTPFGDKDGSEDI
ncbi:hypothetical protein Btru_071824 [Bulinus truncatus]|nr:hypothetical protein Btru_071824 [Bulinus truncatus]